MTRVFSIVLRFCCILLCFIEFSLVCFILMNWIWSFVICYYFGCVYVFVAFVVYAWLGLIDRCLVIPNDVVSSVSVIIVWV